MIERKLHKEIVTLLKQFPAVAILGARQVGKTTLAKQIAAAQKKATLYIDLENPLDVRRLADPYTFLTDNKDKFIIIDEVQTIPSLFAVLRSVIDEDRRNGKFILLGSASPQLVKDVSESLAGRIAYRELSPINFMELPENISMAKHWLRGGFPSALLAKNEKIASEWMNSFVRSYVERDLSSLFGVDLTSNIISRLLSMLAHINGGVWNAEMIARSLGITAPTVNRYVDFLEGAFLVHRLPAFYINTKKRLVKAPKIYIRDSGMLHQLSNVHNINALKGHPVVGSSWE
ncbi:MAG TPA: ATP-binding protein, partial [Ginsengibacter sp.]